MDLKLLKNWIVLRVLDWNNYRFNIINCWKILLFKICIKQRLKIRILFVTLHWWIYINISHFLKIAFLKNHFEIANGTKRKVLNSILNEKHFNTARILMGVFKSPYNLIIETLSASQVKRIIMHNKVLIVFIVKYTEVTQREHNFK